MKKCKKCGALQSDDRTTCIDCNAHLGKPLSDAEAEATEAALDDKLESMAERTEDFYVPLRDKIMGVLCILGIVTAVVVICLTGLEKGKIDQSIPDNVMVTVGNGATVIMTDGTSDYNYPTKRVGELKDVILAAVCTLIALGTACPMLLAPRLMWRLDTLKYRLFYDWDTTPSDFAITIRKAATYLLFGIGMVSVLCAYFFYLT